MKLIEDAEDHGKNAPHNPATGICNQCGKDHYTCDECSVHVFLSPAEIPAWIVAHAQITGHSAGAIGGKPK